MIAATPEAVFCFLIDPNRLSHWMTGLVERTPLTEGGPRVGARARQVVEDAGRRIVFVSEITHLEVNRTLILKLESDLVDAISSYELEASSEGTRLRHRLEPSYKGMMRFMAPMIRGTVQQKLESDLQRLKHAAERGS